MKIDEYSKQFLDQTVTVKIDRPVGSKHPKHGFIYPINYGFVPGIKAPDGEEIDAYILGVDRPLDTFTGTCIAIIHRIDDNDDKLVLAEIGNSYTDEEIKSFTHFQEQWFKSEIIR